MSRRVKTWQVLSWVMLFLKVVVGVCFNQQIRWDYALLINYSAPWRGRSKLSSSTGTDWWARRWWPSAKAVAGCVGACLSLWLLTPPFAVIIATRTCVTPHLKMERGKVQWGKNCHETLNYLHVYLGLAPLTQQGDPAWNTVWFLLFPLTLAHHWCQIFQKDTFNRETTATVCIHWFLWNTNETGNGCVSGLACMCVLLHVPTACKECLLSHSCPFLWGIFQPPHFLWTPALLNQD